MFKNEADFKRLTDRLNIDDKPNPSHRENLRRQMLSAFNEATQESTTRIIDFRTFGRIIMKSTITKLAAAAVIIIAAGIFLYTTNTIVPAAYALQDTIEAYNSIRWLHIDQSAPVGEQIWTSEFWFECDEYGNVNRMRYQTPYCGDAIGSMAIVGNFDESQVWLAGHNLLLVGYGNPSSMAGFDVTIIDPKILFERLKQQEDAGQIILDVNETTLKNEPIIVTVTYPAESLSVDWKKVFYIDKSTCLVTKSEKFQKRDGKFQLVNTYEFSGYNDEIDPAMFSFDGELPDDITTIDMSDIEAGLEQGDMTDEEVATEITRQFYEAVIAKDFTRAGQLYLAAPDFLVEKAFMGANVIEITSVGQVYPDSDPDSNKMICHCKLLIEFGGQLYNSNAQMFVYRIDENPRLWVIGGSSVNVSPVSGEIQISKGQADLSTVTYEDLKPGELMQDWLILEPIRIEVRGDTLFPSEETQKEYFDTEQLDVTQFEPVVNFNDKIYEWAVLENEYGVINLTSVYEDWYLITYLWAQIDMPEEKQGTLGIGSDDSVKVWLNGELVHENWVTRGVGIDNDRVPIKFKKGINQIVIKVQNGGGPWGFCCRLLDE